MKSENEFLDVMKNKTYAELIEIVGKLRNEYQLEAVKAAEWELKNRIEPENIIETKSKKKSKKVIKVDRAMVPLDSNSKIVAFLFPRPYKFLIDFELKDKGYLRKYREWKKWTWIGVLFYVIIFIMVMLIAILV